uniref:transposase n=1 Tax=Candidatus Methylacidithermus pantelleriae TaxID=2744239 RepID=UPI00157C1D3E
MISQEIQPIDSNLFVGIPPGIAVADAVKLFKGITARWRFHRFVARKKRLWGGELWSPS